MKNRNPLLFLFFTLAAISPQVVSSQYVANLSYVTSKPAIEVQQNKQLFAANYDAKRPSRHNRVSFSVPAPLAADGQTQSNYNLLGMTVGIGFGKLRYVVEEERIYDFDWCAVKYAGITIENILASIDEKISIDNNLFFSTFSTQTSTHFADSLAGNPSKNYYDINLKFAPSMVSLSNIARYRLTKGELKYYVGIGFYNSFVISATNKKATTHTLNGVSTTTNTEALPKPATHGLMLLASTGFSYRNIGLEFRFDPGRSFTNKLNYSVYMPQFIGLLHVQFVPKKL